MNLSDRKINNDIRHYRSYIRAKQWGVKLTPLPIRMGKNKSVKLKRCHRDGFYEVVYLPRFFKDKVHYREEFFWGKFAILRALDYAIQMRNY